MPLTRTFKVSGVLTLVGVVLLVLHRWLPVESLQALGVVLLSTAGVVFCFSALRHLFRRVLWRVGSRLFVSYLLLGFVPVIAVALFGYVGLMLLAGQLAARRVTHTFTERGDALQDMARDLASEVSAAKPDERRALFASTIEDAKETFPSLAIVWLPRGGTPETAGPAPKALLPRPWLTGERRRLAAHIDDETSLVAVEIQPGGTLALVQRVDDGFRRSLERETETVLRIESTLARVERNRDGTPRGISLGDGKKKQKSKKLEPGATPGPESVPAPAVAPTDPEVEVTAATADDAPEPAGKGDGKLHLSVGPMNQDGLLGETAAPPAGVGPLSGRWVSFPVPIAQKIVDWETGAPIPNRQIVGIVRSSIRFEYGKLFEGTRIGTAEHGLETRKLAIIILKALGILTAAAYLGASLLAALLVTRIARATGRLSTAFEEVEKGNFAYRASLRGHDQLSTLVASFNEMAAHLASSVTERASREALETELRVARDLQRRLLPPGRITRPGVDVAADFRPAAAIGGDFWHVHDGKDGSFSVAVADVSGHGLPTGIVMAAAKASLSALLSTGAEPSRVFPALDEEIRSTTDARTFVTLALLTFAPGFRRVSFTNAGHIYPWRITAAGDVSSLTNPAKPLGVPLPGNFTTVEADAAAGDLWVLLSDGIVEARTASDDEFGFERLEAVLRESAGLDAEALRDRILAVVQTFVGSDEVDDDRTLIVLKLS